MDFRTELSKWGYNKGNSIDVETLIDEILPSLFFQQQRSYSEEEVLEILKMYRNSIMEVNPIYIIYLDKWFKNFKNK